MALFGTCRDSIRSKDRKDEVGDYQSESGCDHIVTVIPGCRNRMTDHFAMSVLASEYGMYYRKTYNDEKFDFCPKCGEKINWKELENKIGISKPYLKEGERKKLSSKK